MSIMVGVGKGARTGVLIKNAEALERFAVVDTLVVDKTGTLTEGRPALRAVDAANGFDEDDILSIAAALEQSSAHPLAHAILSAAEAKELALAPIANFESVSGKGVRGRIDGRRAAIGNAAMMAEESADPTGLAPVADSYRNEGATVMFLAVDGVLAGLIAVSDPITATKADAIRRRNRSVKSTAGKERDRHA